LTPRVHPTAQVEADVVIGEGTSIWDHVHLRGPSRIGRECIVGGKTYVAYGVTIGDRVKLNSFVYVCTDVTIEDGVMVSAGTIFTNDRFPRAATPDLQALLPSEPDEHTLATRVREGATLGARSVVGPGVTIGRFAMVGMGAVVTRSVPDFHLVVGHPARSVGIVCRCGQPVARFDAGVSIDELPPQEGACASCGWRYQWKEGRVTEIQPR